MPELVGDVWLNNEPLRRDDLANRSILVDFWTYSCVDCSLPLPYIRNWWEKYAGSDFVLIGIHTPEFEFEKDPSFMAGVLEDLAIKWPMLLDNDGTNWNNFSVQRLPAMYLVNRKGNIVYTHIGEGAYHKTEENIRLLLGEKPGEGLTSPLEVGQRLQDEICFQPTPELYCGHEKGALANADGFVPGQEADYILPAAPLETGSIALSGRFLSAHEYAENAEAGAAIHVSFYAIVVNIVALPQSADAVAIVKFNGESLGGELIGKDVNQAGEVIIDRPLMYNLLRSDDIAEGVLTVEVKSGVFQTYAFTFSGCVE